MKSIFQRGNLALLIVLAGFLAQASAQQPASGPGVPGGAPVQIDPVTGMPNNPEMQWKDPNWKDPVNVLTEVNYDNLPLGEVARNLSERFKDEFDILLPSAQSSATFNPATVMPVTDTDWRGTQIQLRLKNVTASEIFNAMNLLFENDKTPLRWELKVNGHRQIALLRVLAQPIWKDAPQIPPPHPNRQVYFVGDLIGDTNMPGMTMDEVVQTITEVRDMTTGDPSHLQIQFHKAAQLLIVTEDGNGGQINFIQDTLKALRSKVETDRERKKMAELKAKETSTKSGANAGSR